MPYRVGIDARLQAYRKGGIASHVTCLLAGLERLGPPERIVLLAHRREQSSVTAFETRRLVTPPHHRLESWALPLELLRARLDLLHSPDFVTPRMWPRASVVTVHDLAFFRRPELLTRDSSRYYRGVRRSVRAAHRVIAVSDHTRRELLSLTAVDPARVRVVHNGVHPSYFQRGSAADDAAAVSEMGVREPFILFVSTIEPRKNVTTLLEAYRRLRDEGVTASLALAGADGWHSKAVYDRAEELGLSGKALFLGFVDDDGLGALYRRAALLAHPAIDEGFGLTPLEAMASGCPVVASNAGSLPEVLGTAAVLLPPADVDEWTSAVRAVLASPARLQELAERGMERSARFTVELMAERTLAVYREALTEWGGNEIGQ